MPFCTFCRKDGWTKMIYMADPPPTYRLEGREYRRFIMGTGTHAYDLSPDRVEYQEVE